MAGKNGGPLQLPSGKTWWRPATKSYTVDLGNGREASVTVSFGLGNVPAKLYCLGRVVRNEDGTPKTMNVRVQCATIKCKVSGKGNTGEIKASSYCKPPDQFCVQTGTHLALKHLFRRDSEADAILSGTERRAILEAVCPWLVANAKKAVTPTAPVLAKAAK
jgi:hypothetical protein